MLDLWWVCLILYLIIHTAAVQFYKLCVKDTKDDASLSVLIDIFSALSTIIFLPFFKMVFPDIKILIVILISSVFYALNDRLKLSSRKNLEVSVITILEQLSNIFLIIIGIVFLKENILISKILGGIIILSSNMFLFYEKGKFTFNKYAVISVISSMCIAIALSIDVGYSNLVNLALYKTLTFALPALFIAIFEKTGFKKLKSEFKTVNKPFLILASLLTSMSVLLLLRCYELNSITIISPLSTLTVILSIIFSYIFLKERKNLTKKIFAAIGILIGIIIISIF